MRDAGDHGGGARPSRCSRERQPKTNSTVPNGSKKLPAFVIPPVSITKANYTRLFNGFLKRSDVCAGAYKKYCKSA